jgi:hypothetical protein
MPRLRFRIMDVSGLQFVKLPGRKGHRLNAVKGRVQVAEQYASLERPMLAKTKTAILANSLLYSDV